MKRERLDKARLKELWDRFIEIAPWGSWVDDYERELRSVADQDEATLRTPAAQQALWKSPGLGTAGPSESIDVTAATVDSAFVDELVLLRKRAFDPAPSRRAKELQQIHDKLLGRLTEVLDGNIPRARLVRTLHALRPGDFVCTWNKTSLFAVRDFLVGQRGLGRAENHVLARARLRDVLGDEADLREHARRSIFCWWLHDNAETIAAGGLPDAPSEPTPEPSPDDEPPELSVLEPKPLSRQHRWLDLYSGGLDTVRLVLRECLEPQSLELLGAGVRGELGETAARRRYLLTMMRDLRHLGFIEKVGDDYRTTEDGEALLDKGGESVLAESLVINLKGFAHVLRALESGPLGASDIEPVLAPFGPGGKPSDLPRRHLWWADLAGIVQWVGANNRELTSEGRALAARLPDELEQPDAPPPEPPEPPPPVGEDATLPTFGALWARFQELAKEEGLVFSRNQVLALHTAWRFGEPHATAKRPPKRFAILSGLSGTGKTQLLLQYARATCALMDLPERAHMQLVPVRPDWRDPTGLLGYLNALHSEPTFQAEPALRLVLRAAADPGRPYFLLLDEMNLARVERYFAPFLSAMETGASLELHAHDEPIGDIPPWVRWPANLRIGGTVNMDETTHPFSDKVLDRAFTLEFWNVELEAFFEHRANRTPADKVVEETLLAFQQHLRPIRRHVGYRTAGEVLAWVAHARETLGEAEPSAHLIDQALFSKVLPRLRGGESAPLRAALDALLGEAKARSLSACADKLALMQQRLADTGVTGFWA